MVSKITVTFCGSVYLLLRCMGVCNFKDLFCWPEVDFFFRVTETYKESFLQDFRHMAIEDFDDLFPFTTGL